jgi:hypothetical protein
MRQGMEMLSNPLEAEHHEEFLFVDDMAQAVVFALENTLPIIYTT